VCVCVCVCVRACVCLSVILSGYLTGARAVCVLQGSITSCSHRRPKRRRIMPCCGGGLRSTGIKPGTRPGASSTPWCPSPAALPSVSRARAPSRLARSSPPPSRPVPPATPLSAPPKAAPGAAPPGASAGCTPSENSRAHSLCSPSLRSVPAAPISRAHDQPRQSDSARMARRPARGACGPAGRRRPALRSGAAGAGGAAGAARRAGRARVHGTGTIPVPGTRARRPDVVKHLREADVGVQPGRVPLPRALIPVLAVAARTLRGVVPVL